MKAAIIGYGVVGSGVYEILKENAGGIAQRAGQSIEIKYILDIRDFPDHPESGLFVKDYSVILDDPEVEAVVETMGGVRFAYDYTRQALLRGKSVVTSNKELVAEHGHEFFALAREHNCRYLYEASVGGGIPIIRPLARCLAANEIESVAGIINGTTNFILTKMFRGNQSFESALKAAQENGYAEKDPSADIEGRDVCRKIAILASLCLGKRVSCADIPTEGITSVSAEDMSYAEALGCSIKLIGRAVFRDGRAGVSVGPMMVPKSCPLAGVEDVFNAVAVKGNMVGDCVFMGRGAGKLPTASAVVADLIDAAVRGGYSGEFSWEDDGSAAFDPAGLEDKFFVRILPKAQKAVTERFSGAEFIRGVSDLGFVTETMSGTELDRRLVGVEGVVSRMRIYQ